MSSKPSSAFARIAVAATVSGTAGRDYLSGVFKYANAGKRWSVEVFNGSTEIDRRLERPDDLDGVIIMTPHEHLVLDRLRASHLPTVIVDFPPSGYPMRKDRISFVRMNDESIGVAAAEHFLSRGSFNAFACVIDEPGFKYTEARRNGFVTRLGQSIPSGRSVKTLVIPEAPANRREIRSFQLHLSRLPRPLAVFAVRDRAAVKVFDACRTFGLAIPDEVAVLGVDNDELFCNTMPVQLSSIHPDHEKVGWLVARELSRLMRGGACRHIVVDKPVKDVALRASTRIVPPTARIVSDILGYIDAHVSGSLRVSEVVSRLGIPRRLADLRFRQIRGESILDAIVRARIARAKKLLLSTDASLSEISRSCGFSSPAVFTRFFKLHIGMTPRDWRLGRSA